MFIKNITGYGNYSLHNIIPPAGYSASADVDFEINTYNDWSYPYKINVPLSPIKNRVRIKAEDVETEEPVPDGVYTVIAAENIKSVDGTVRYQKGDNIDEITCDDKGYGQSKELYVGKYLVRQKKAQRYYAINKEDIEVTSTENPEESEVYTIKCEKTKATIVLTDEYNGDPIKDAEFKISANGEYSTDENGEITVTDLQKDMTYNLELTSLPEPYRELSDNISFKVNKSGLIEGEAQAIIKYSAYTTRIMVDVKSMILRSDAKNYDVTIYDKNGTAIETWNSADVDHIIKGLKPGNYTVSVNGKEDSKINVTISDNGKLQHASVFIWTLLDTLSIVAVVVLLILTTILVLLINKNKKKRKGKGN